ncbi:MAG: ribosome maturation factor RimM [Rickettsiales bacterium]
MNKKILIAKILSPHGIKGDVKVIYYGDNVKNLEKYPLFDINDNEYFFKIKNFTKTSEKSNNNGDKFAIASIKNVDDRNHAEKLKGLEIYSYREHFQKTKKNEFYIIDLVGLKVLNMQNQEIGTVVNVLNNATTAIEIEFLDNFIPNGFSKISNFPFKNDLFPEIDIEKSIIKFDPPEFV